MFYRVAFFCFRFIFGFAGDCSSGGIASPKCDDGGVAAYGKSGSRTASVTDIDFDVIIAEVVSAIGWTWDEALDNLTLPRLIALRKEWRRHPPVHWLVASALKYKTPDETTITKQPSVAELQAAFLNAV